MKRILIGAVAALLTFGVAAQVVDFLPSTKWAIALHVDLDQEGVKRFHDSAVKAGVPHVIDYRFVVDGKTYDFTREELAHRLTAHN